MSIHAIQSRISGVRARLRALYLVHGLFRIAFLAALFVLASFVLDAWLHLPLAVRIGLASLAGLGLLWLAWRHLVFPAVFPISSDDIAKHVEREHPFLAGRLVATLQLSRLVGRSDYADSVAMTEALFRETEGLLGQVDFGRILRPGRVARSGLMPLGAIAAVALVAAVWPIHARIWLARNVFFDSMSWPRATTVGLVARTWSVAPETAVPVSIDAGDDADDVELVLHHRPLFAVDQEWSAVELARGADGRFEGAVPGLTADAVFWVEILPADRTALTYVPDPDRRSPYYVLSVDADRAPAVGTAEPLEIALPDSAIETSAGVYPVAAYVDGEVPREVALVGTSESGHPIEIQLSQKAVDREGEDGEVGTIQTRIFERGLELAESCRFHLEAGDDTDDDPTWSVRVMVPPKLDQAIVWMEYPEYMGRVDKPWVTYQEISVELESIRKEIGGGQPTPEQAAKLQSFEARHRNALLEVERAERKTHIGSVVHLRTRSNQPLSKAWLVFDRSPLAKEASRIPIEPTGSDRRELAVSIDLDNRFDQEGGAGRDQPDVRRVEFHLEAVAETGLATRRPTAHTLHVVRDKPPEFSGILPFKTESRIERANVALVPFEAKVVDDYGITRLEIDVYTGDGDEEPTERVVVFEHDGRGPPPAEHDLRHTFDLELMERVETTRVGTRRRALEDGDVVRFRVRATDNRKVERLRLEPQTREIGLYRITIISKGKVLEQTDKDLSALKNLILEMRNREIRLRDGTADLFTKLAGAAAGDFRKEGLELASEQTDRITRAAEGISVSLREVNERFTVNNIESERPSHLVEMLPLIDAVAKDLSPAVAARLDEMARGEPPDPRREAARQAIDGQSKVIDHLDQLLGLLTKWENYYEVVQEARRLRELQDTINRLTRERFQD